YNNTYDFNAATLVSVSSGVETAGIDFPLVVGAHISGKVTDASGAPIALASVQATRDVCCGGGFTMTLADGTFMIRDLPPGDYRVQASALGYAGAYYCVSPCTDPYSTDRATLVHASSGAETTDVNIALAPEGRISGTVTSAADGAPLNRAVVFATREACCGYQTAVSASDGTYVIRGLPPGVYRVAAEKLAG